MHREADAPLRGQTEPDQVRATTAGTCHRALAAPPPLTLSALRNCCKCSIGKRDCHEIGEKLA